LCGVRSITFLWAGSGKQADVEGTVEVRLTSLPCAAHSCTGSAVAHAPPSDRSPELASASLLRRG
jgi:hypothetical protein